MSAPKTACVVLAGGRSLRFGEPKGLAKLGGKTLLQWIMEALATQSKGPIWINTDPAGPYADQGFTIIQDQDFLGEGPLSGIYSALQHAKRKEAEHLITVPLDTPFIPDTYVHNLSRGVPAAVAKSRGQIHPLCGIWSTQLAGELARFLDTADRSAIAWTRFCNANIIEFDNKNGVDPFFNINSQADLDRAQELTAYASARRD